MEELLKAINIVVSEGQKFNTALQNAVTYANNIIKEADAKLKAASDKEAANEEYAKELSEREAKVSKIENIVKLEEDGRALAKQNKEAESRLEGAKEAFAKESGETLKKIASQTKKNVDDGKMLTKEWEAYHKREADLKKREEDYKERIAKNIVANVKG